MALIIHCHVDVFHWLIKFLCNPIMRCHVSLHEWMIYGKFLLVGGVMEET
jgi:hypothetical protein